MTFNYSLFTPFAAIELPHSTQEEADNEQSTELYGYGDIKGPKDLTRLFDSQGISLDLKNKKVYVKGTVIRDSLSPQYPIEYVVVSEGGNTHEAFILIKAKPSILNAALLCLGLKPGKTVTKKEISTASDTDLSTEYKTWVIIPPTGTVVNIYLNYDGWKDNQTKRLEDLLLNINDGTTMNRNGWVYTGSRFATVLLGRKKEKKYMADMERNIVACYLTGFGNAIFDINCLDGINDSMFDVNPEQAPPMNSKVTIIFSLDPSDR